MPLEKTGMVRENGAVQSGKMCNRNAIAVINGTLLHDWESAIFSFGRSENGVGRSPRFQERGDTFLASPAVVTTVLSGFYPDSEQFKRHIEKETFQGKPLFFGSITKVFFSIRLHIHCGKACPFFIAESNLQPTISHNTLFEVKTHT